MSKRTASSYRRIIGSGAMGLAMCSIAACQGAPDSEPGPEPVKPKPPVINPATPQSLSAISGGTLLVTRDGATVVAADPDRDSVWVVDAAAMKLRHRVKLGAAVEPGRLVEDQDGNLHVALRRGGQVVKIDPKAGSVVSARAVCAAPRGLAYDSATDNLHVACATGELVTLKARGGDIERSLNIDSDLRDVVVKGDHLLVSRFRSAELLELDASGKILARTAPRPAVGDGIIRDPMGGSPATSSPTTAWRLQTMPDSQVVMLHQRAFDGTVNVTPGMTPGGPMPGGPGGYGSGPCKGSSIVTPGLTLFSGSTVGNGGMLSMMAMAVDLAISPDGKELSVVSLSSGLVPGSSVTKFQPGQLDAADHCQFPGNVMPAPITGVELTAIAYGPDKQLWAQARNPAAIHVIAGGAPWGTVELTGAEDRSDEGHQLFHKPTNGLIACASCHAESGDDSHVWNFGVIGPRRTQNLRGGILATAPFHWDGDMKDMTTLMGDVFVNRMGGQQVNASQVAAIGSWLDGQSLLPKAAPHDPQAVERGKALFNDAKVACASCHSGEHLTGNQSADVGTGKAFQVPSLIGIATRAPYMHNGCAKTLRARFDAACGGGDRHGQTSHLAPNQIDDLVLYLETL